MPLLNHIHTRRMARADITRLVMIEAEAHVGPWPREFFEHWYDHASCCIVATDDRDTIYGYTFAVIRGSVMYWLNLTVDKKYWRKGVGTHLLDALLMEAHAQGVVELVATVRQGNTKIRRFCESHSFTGRGLVKDYYPPFCLGAEPEHATIYIKSLEESI